MISRLGRLSRESALKKAIEERKILQDIINKQEEMSFKIRGWAIAIFSALTYIYFRHSCGKDFSAFDYLLSVAVALFIFYRAEKRHLECFFKLIVYADELENVGVVHQHANYFMGIEKALQKKYSEVMNSQEDHGAKKRFREVLGIYWTLFGLACVVAFDLEQMIGQAVPCLQWLVK